MLLTTHIVEEAAAVADRVVVLHRGRVVAADTPAGLTDLLPDRTITARTALDDAALQALPGVAHVHREGGRVRVGTAEPERVLRRWLALDEGLTDLRVEGAGLDDALLALTGDSVPADSTSTASPSGVPA
jgi:ABC-2 type transport system ATP-binding protein